MKHYDFSPGAGYRESPVKLNRTFGDLSRRDVRLKQRGDLLRVISYPTPSDESLAIRQSLAGQRLVMGEKITSRDKGLEQFIIPDLARPISRDKGLRKSGPYNDEDLRLFFHLGRLLGRVAQEGPELPFVLQDTVGLNAAAAVTDHDRRQLGESAILLVPGFECQLGTVEDDDAVLGFYSDKLHDEFGPRFEEGQERFTEGFCTTLGF